MSEREVEVKLIEVEVIKLDPNAKYLITIKPENEDLVLPLQEALMELIGPNFIVGVVERDTIKAIQVAPKEES